MNTSARTILIVILLFAFSGMAYAQFLPAFSSDRSAIALSQSVVASSFSASSASLPEKEVGYAGNVVLDIGKTMTYVGVFRSYT